MGHNVHAYGESNKCGMAINEDAVKLQKINGFLVMGVYDGNGAHEGMINLGQLASNIIVDYLMAHLKEYDTMDAVRNYIADAFFVVSRSMLSINAIDSKYEACYTSASIMVLNELSLDFAYGSIGNTEIDCFRNRKIIRINRVGSEAYNDIMSGALNEADYYASPKRGIVTSAFGVFQNYSADIGIGKLFENDVFFLATDGVFSYYNPGDVLDMFAEEGQAITIEKGVRKVLDAINEKAPVDNATLICGFIEPEFSDMY